MKEERWVNIEVGFCPICQEDYPLGQEACPRCGGSLLAKTRRVPAEDE
jgi:hypothetical protein